jgi:hypothetical protein
MDNVQKVNNYDNIPLSQTSKSCLNEAVHNYLCALMISIHVFMILDLIYLGHILGWAAPCCNNNELPQNTDYYRIL